MSENLKKWLKIAWQVALLILGGLGVNFLSGIHTETKAQTAIMRGHP